VLDRLPRAEQIARQLGDKARLAQALMWQASAHVVSGFASRGMEAMIEGQELASELGDETLAMLPQFMMSMSLVDHDPRDGIAQLDEVIDLAHTHKNREIESHALAAKAVALARLGEFEPARKTIDEALAVVPHAHSPVKEADVNASVALAYFDMGDVERGIEHSRLAAEKAASAGAVECTIYSHLATGTGNLRKPDLRDAAAAFEQAIKVTEGTPSNLRALINEGLTNQVRAGRAIVQFFDGRDEALADIEAALANARGMGDEYFAAYLAHTLGNAYTRLGDFQRAEESFQRALKYYTRTDLRPYRVRTLEALATTYDRAGRSADAERARAEAQEVAQALQPG
jgi:tetratricopeptide (TPR) repeat protein